MPPWLAEYLRSRVGWNCGFGSYVGIPVLTAGCARSSFRDTRLQTVGTFTLSQYSHLCVKKVTCLRLSKKHKCAMV